MRLRAPEVKAFQGISFQVPAPLSICVSIYLSIYLPTLPPQAIVVTFKQAPNFLLKEFLSRLFYKPGSTNQP